MAPLPRPGRQFVPRAGILFDGHPDDPALVEQQVIDWLESRITDRWRLRAMRRHLDRAETLRTWWAGDTIGFCQESHPNAEPVTVVPLPTELESILTRGDL